MKTPLSGAQPRTLDDVMNALIRRSMDVRGLPDAFHDECCTELARLSAELTKDAEETDGMATYLRKSVIAELCDQLAHPDTDMRDRLFEIAKRRWSRIQQAAGQPMAQWIAELRLCLLLGEIPPEHIGIDVDVLGVELETAGSAP